jgi:short-subunit dehydrogenase
MLAQSGCRVILAARTRFQLEEVHREIRDRGGEALVVAADLTRDEDIQQLVETGRS